MTPVAAVTTASPSRRRSAPSRAAEAWQRLEASYGRPRNTHRLAPLDELILTVLSQHTNDRNRDRAYAALRRQYPRWEDVLAATDAAVARAIRSGGLANQKAARIRQILQQIQEERGALNLEFLRRWSATRAAAYLIRFKGVGEKTANCVLLFSMNKRAFPVDTHIHRIALRLGLAPDGSDAAEAHHRMHDLVPPADYYAVHMNLIRHGREVCQARTPACDACVLLDLCPAGRKGRRTVSGQDRKKR